VAAAAVLALLPLTQEQKLLRGQQQGQQKN